MIKLGAYDYISKPLYPDEILATIHKALEQPRAEAHVNTTTLATATATENKQSKAAAKAPPNPEGYLMGDSDISQELYRQNDLAAPTHFSIVLFVECGTGKDAEAKQSNQIERKIGI